MGTTLIERRDAKLKKLAAKQADDLAKATIRGGLDEIRAALHHHNWPALVREHLKLLAAQVDSIDPPKPAELTQGNVAELGSAGG